MAYIHAQHKQVLLLIVILGISVAMINDRQQTLQKVDIQIRSAGITLKNVYRNRSAEERRQLSLLVSHDKTWQKHRSSSLHAVGVCIDVITGLVIDYELILSTLLK